VPRLSSIRPEWLCGGDRFFPAMLDAIAQACQTVELEMYIVESDELGLQFLAALIAAARRGVRVRVLVDSFGSVTLDGTFFAPLAQAGGEARYFNPLRFNRFGVRDHRKLLVCDSRVAFIGGANLTASHRGDGVTHGWLDVVAQVTDPWLATRLREEFDRIFPAADFNGHALQRLRIFRRLRRNREMAPWVLPVIPGRGVGAFQRAFSHDLATAHQVDIMVPYFLPSHRLRRQLRRVVKRGGRVRLILPALCDVPLARAAGMVYYPRLLRAGVELYEYQPQILHAKLYAVDGKVYAGSANLDVRSNKLNYELMIRFSDPASEAQVRSIFETALTHSHRIDHQTWKAAQNFWQRWKNRWANFLLTRIDPLLVLKQTGR
jgi:cardiolipin synthase A/B